MSTNYYLINPTGATYHIGKTAAGWQFLFDTAEFQATEIKSFNDWFTFIEAGLRIGWRLENEYGDEVVMMTLRERIMKDQRTGVNCWTASPEQMGPCCRVTPDQGYFFDNRGFWFSRSRDFG